MLGGGGKRGSTGGGGGSANWGSIGGTLSAQADLQSALDAKQNTLPTLTNGQIWQFQSSALAATTNLKDTSNANSIEVNARILRGTNGTSSKLDWSSAIPNMQDGLTVGGAGSFSGPVFVARKDSASTAALAEYLNDTNNSDGMEVYYRLRSAGTMFSFLTLSFANVGSSGPQPALSVYNKLVSQSEIYGWSWGPDYYTYLKDGRFFLASNQAYLDPTTTYTKFTQAISGDASVNNYYWTGVLDSATTDDLFYKTITDEGGIVQCEEIYAYGSGNTIPGGTGWVNGFQGVIFQQRFKTDDTDTGWAFKFRTEDFARLQIGGHASYQMQVKNAAGDLIGGFRGFRPVVNSANVTPQTLTATGNYIEYVDETGASHFIPTFA